MKQTNVGDTLTLFRKYSIESRYSVVSLGKTLYGTFPCLVVLANSSKLHSHLY